MPEITKVLKYNTINKAAKIISENELERPEISGATINTSDKERVFKYNSSIVVGEKDMKAINKIATENVDAMLMGINLGIHEYTHILPFIYGFGGSLTEFSTYITQNSNGLPLKTPLFEKMKKTDADSFRFFQYSLRDYQHNRILSRKIGRFNDDYFAMLAGPWVKKYAEENKLDIYSFPSYRKGYSQDVKEIFVELFKSSIVDWKIDRNAFYAIEGIEDKGLRKEFDKVFDQLEADEIQDIFTGMEKFQNILTKINNII